MKINNISFTQKFPVVKKPEDKPKKIVLSVLPQKEVIKPLLNGKKLILKGFNNSDDNTVNYIGVLDKNNNLIQDIRFDRRYNEIRAIEYKKPSGGFGYIKSSVSVSLDKDNEIRNIYFISHNDDDSVTHSSLNIKHGFDTKTYQKDNNFKPTNREDVINSYNCLVNYTKSVLNNAQDNNLEGSKNILEKFSNFINHTNNLLCF